MALNQECCDILSIRKSGYKVFMNCYKFDRTKYKKALKVVLSAKLAEGKLRIIDSERVDEPKTRSIAKILEKMDSRSRILIVHPY